MKETNKHRKAKKKWGKPKLIILTRGKPEEAVLVACKWGDSFIPAGPVYEQAMCISYTGTDPGGNLICGGCLGDAPT